MEIKKKNLSNILKSVNNFSSDLFVLREKFCGSEINCDKLSDSYDYKKTSMIQNNTVVYEKIYRSTEINQDISFYSLRIFVRSKTPYFLRDIQIIINYKKLLENNYRKFSDKIIEDVAEIRDMLNSLCNTSKLDHDIKDIERVCTGITLKNEAYNDPKERIFNVLACRASELLNAGLISMAARNVIAMTRGLGQCKWENPILQIAETASKLNMPFETIFILQKLQTNNAYLSGPDWNRLGCCLFNLKQYESALDCFINFYIDCPKDQAAVGNILLTCRKILYSSIIQKNPISGINLEDIITKFLPKDDKNSDILSMLGLSFEVNSNFSNAIKYYKKAFELNPEDDQAKAALERSNMHEEYREAELEIYLNSFPFLPEPKRIGRIPTEIIEPIPLGGAWETLYPNFDEEVICKDLTEHLQKARVYKEVDYKRKKETDLNVNKYYSLLEIDSKESPKLCVMSVLCDFVDGDNNSFLSFYPFNMHIKENTLQITSISEFEGGFEAILECQTEFGASISFFDTMYYDDRRKYRPDYLYTYMIGGFAHEAQICDKDDLFKIDKGPTFENYKLDKLKENPDIEESEIEPMTINKGSGYLMSLPGDADCGFRIKASKVHTLKFKGSTVFGIETVFINSPDDDIQGIEGMLYILEDKLQGKIPKEGDIIEGSCWLQGTMVNILEDSSFDDNEDFMNLSNMVSIRKQENNIHDEMIKLLQNGLSYASKVKDYYQIEKYISSDPDFAVINNKNEISYIYLNKKVKSFNGFNISIELKEFGEDYYNVKVKGWGEFLEEI